MQNTSFDILILGGGMAGMTAAIHAVRGGHSCIILEKNITGGLGNTTHMIENFPSYIAVHGVELMEKVRVQVNSLGVQVEEICKINKGNLEGKVKTIIAEEAVYTAKAVIIATGRSPIPLQVPTGHGECEQIHYCTVVDDKVGYSKKKILVLGGGNSAFDESLYLMQLGVAHLTLVEEKDRFFAAEITQKQLLAHPNVTALARTKVEDIVMQNGKLEAVVLQNLESGEIHTVAVDELFVFLGQIPNSDMFQGMIPLDEDGYILVDENMCTAVSGVFSAGDVNQKQFRSLVTAAADGSIAGLMADQYLRLLE